MNIQFNYNNALEEVENIIKTVEANKDKIIEEIGIVGKKQVQSNIKTMYSDTPIDYTGNFRKSIHYIPSENKIIIADGVGYGYDIEFGTQPGRKVPLKNLVPWVHRKIKPGGKIVPQQTLQQEAGLSYVTYTYADVAIAKAVQKKIFEEGTDARPVFQHLDRQMPPKIEKIIKKYI